MGEKKLPHQHPGRSQPLWKALALAVAMALVVAACGDADEPEPQADEPTDSDDETEEATDAAEEPDDETGDSGNGYVNPGVGFEERDSEHLPDDWDEVVAAAAEEGEVVVFTNHNQAITDPIIEAFREAFPDIEVRQVRDSVDVLPTRYVTEHEAQGSTPADLLESALFEQVVAEHPEWFIPIRDLVPNEIPTLNDYNMDQASPEGRPLSVGSAAYVWSFVYNTDAVPEDEVPTEWCELADPRWSGMMADPRAATTYLAFQHYLYETCGAEFSQALSENGWVLSDAVAPIGEQVAAGAYDVGFPLARAHTMALREEGAPVAHLDLKPARLGGTTMMFPVDPPNPNARRVFASFILSAQAQELQCTYGALSSLNQKVEGDCLDMSIGEDALVLDLEVSEDERAALLDAMGLE